MMRYRKYINGPFHQWFEPVTHQCTDALPARLPAARPLSQHRNYTIRRILLGPCAIPLMIFSRGMWRPAGESSWCQVLRINFQQCWTFQLASLYLAGTARMIESWGGSPRAHLCGNQTQKRQFSKVRVAQTGIQGIKSQCIDMSFI